ncbi:MAG: hypothetical protein ACRC92_18245 [Peptostreptococcaceae bacterium]
MIKAIGVTLLSWILITAAGSFTLPFLNNCLFEGSIPESYLYIIYFGLMIFAGILILTTILIFGQLDKSSNKKKNKFMK